MPSDPGGGARPTPPTPTTDSASGRGGWPSWGGRPLDPFGTVLLLLLAGLALRVVVAVVILPKSGFANDVGAFALWAGRLAEVGPGQFYTPGFFADYPPGFMYVLWLLGSVGQWLTPILGVDPIAGLVKVPGMVADIGVGLMVFVIARRFLGSVALGGWRGSGERMGLIGTAVYLFNPGTVFNSAVWGQMDAVGALVILLGLYALGRGWTEAAGLAAVVAMLVKFQFGWLIPIVIVVGLKRHLLGRSSDPELADRPDPVRILTSVAVSFGALVALILPFGMTVWPTGDPNTGLIDKLLSAAGTYTGLSINAFNIWRNPWTGLGNTQWWGDDQTIAFALGGLGVTWAMVGIVLFAAAAALVLVAVARRDDMQGLLIGSLAMAVAFFGLPTRVHERYLFPALALAAPLAGTAVRWAVAFVVLSGMFFLNVYWVYSDDWSRTLPVITNPGLGGEPFGRDPLLAATVLTDWGIYLISMSVAVVLGWILWQAAGPGLGIRARRRRSVEVVAPAVAGGADRPGALARWRWLRQDPVPESEREPHRRLDGRDLALVAGVVALALVLRLWRLDQPRQMIFDEVYHARTATDFLADWRWGWNRDAYEWTHPMLAKYLIAAGIVLADPNRVTGTTSLEQPAITLAVAPQRTAYGRPASILFAAGGGRTIEARDASTGALVSSWDADGPVATLAWDPDAARLLAGLTDDGQIAAWDLTAFLAANGERGPPPATAGIETGLPRVDQIVLPLDDPLIVARGPDGIVVLDRATGALTAQREITVSAVAYTSGLTGDNPVTARVVAVDLAREEVLSLEASTLETVSRERPQAAPTGALMTSGRGTNQLVWVPIGPLAATDEHPATSGGLLVLKGGALSNEATLPLPGPARALAWDLVANLVYVAGPSSVWVIEPHGDNRSSYALYDETDVIGQPLTLALDVSDSSAADDHGQLIVSVADRAGGRLVRVDVSDNAFAWRLAGVLFGSALAGLVYLLAAMLFRRRSIAVLAALFVAVDLMSYAMSRIAMNDIFVATFIVAAYALFWPIWGGRWARSAWWALPLVGVLIGLAAGAKWVGWYALIGLWFAVLLRSQLGRFVLVAAAGFGAVAVGIGAPWPFTLIAFAILGLGLAVAWVRPVRLAGADLTAIPAVALVIGGVGLAFALAFPMVAGREPHSLVELGFAFLFRGIQAGWPAVVALAVAGLLVVARAARSLWRPASDARWHAPGEMAGFAWPWVFACLVIVPVAVYVATYVPWLNLGHTVAIPGQGPGYGWSLDELHAQMFGYHYGLQAGHAASSPWWSWPLALKPVWFYSHSFDLSQIAVTYNGGNPALFWVTVPAVLAALLLAWRRRSWALLLVVVAFGFQFLPWARIERAAFAYHYLTASLFAFVAVAYVLGEILRDRSWRDYGVAFLVVVAIVGVLIYPLNSALAMPDWYVNAARALPPWNYAFQFPAPAAGERPPLISADPTLLAVATAVSLAAAAIASFGRDLLPGGRRAGSAAPEGGEEDEDADHHQPDRPDEVEVEPG